MATTDDLYYSTLKSDVLPSAEKSLLSSKEQLRDFMAVFPDIVRNLTEDIEFQEVPEATKWLATVLQYNLLGGKMNRGIALVSSYKLLQEGRNLTPEDLRLANVLGWCLEMFQAFLVIFDDIMDNSEMRRGQPCWYRQENVGLSGINDAVLVQSAMNSTIRNNFRDKPYYTSLLDIFNETLMKTSIGQHLDLCSANGGKPNISKFSMKLHNSIVKYKTSYYSFHLPVAAAMLMSNIHDPRVHQETKNILMEIGEFFQIQDDFLDCYGDISVTGKLGTDIQTGKCSWLAVMALQRANLKQKKLMEEFYGIDDPVAVNTIKTIYEELDLRSTYAVYEETTYNLIKTHIQQITNGVPHSIFYYVLDSIYKRKS